MHELITYTGYHYSTKHHKIIILLVKLSSFNGNEMMFDVQLSPSLYMPRVYHTTHHTG